MAPIPAPDLDAPWHEDPVLQLRTSKMKTMLNLTVKTGIYKEPRLSRVYCSLTGLESDEHDLTFHGGPEKAVHQYYPGHYPLWRAEFPSAERLGAFTPGGFGEKIFAEKINEMNVCIGDKVRVREVLLQVYLPRQPCFKLNHRFGVKMFARQTWEKSRTGWYYRVLEEGWMGVGDRIVLVERMHPMWTIERIQEYFHRNTDRIDMLTESDSPGGRKGRLLVIAEQKEKKLKSQADELDELKEKYDILNRAKDSFKSEKEDLAKELEIIKKDFTLDKKTAAYFEQQFADICSNIEEIAWKYFHDINEEEWEETYKLLIAKDSCFKSVPIDDTQDSSDLCAAHAQRIITAAVYDDVWQPLRSELTILNPDFGTLLVKMSGALDKIGQLGRTANVWTALTMRALQALDAEAETAPVPVSEQNIRSPSYNRANSVVSKVVQVLGSLVSAPRIESLKTDLLAVVNSSVDVRNSAQAGSLRITIDMVLDRAQREEWRSKRFDPVSSLADGHDLDLISQTRPRVFILFPRIVARTQEKRLPGS